MSRTGYAGSCSGVDGTAALDSGTGKPVELAPLDRPYIECRTARTLKLQLAISPSTRITNSPNYKWWVYVAVAVGVFLTVMDQSGVNIALPRIAEHFDVDIPTVQWVTLGYVLSTSVMLMPMGRLADMLGRKRVFISGFLIFMGAAAVGGLARSYLVLIGAKLAQGVGAAAIQANGMAMITEAFPERERGKALGMYMTIIGTGSISGPVIGGLLVTGLGWRSVFFAAIPVGLMAVAANMVVLKDRNPAGTGASRGFDWPGAGLSSGALVSFLLAMTNGHRLGWDAPPIVGGFVAAVVLLVTFVWWERRAADPMLDLGLFRSKVFSMGVSARGLSFLAGSAVFFLMPFYLVQVLQYPASTAGLLMVPGSIGTAIIGPIGGRLSDRVGTKWPAVVGLTVSSTALFLFTRLEVDSHWTYVALGITLSGAGMGMFSATNTSAVLGSISRERYGIAAAFLNLVRTSSNVTGVAVATTIVSVTMGSLGYEPNLGAVVESGGEGVHAAFVTGLSRAFIVASGFTVLALVLSVLRGEGRRTLTLEREPAGSSRPSYTAGGKD